MDMQIRPIFASLRKHRIPATLIVLEIALACAVLCNAVFMIGTRLGDIRLGNAIDEQNLSVVTVNGANPKLAQSDIPRNLEALRHITGVQSAAIMNTAPLTNNGWNSSFTATDDPKANGPTVAEYFIGTGADKVLGLQLKQGRLFTPDEYAEGSIGSSFLPEQHVVVVTQTLAKRMWPGESALGKKMYVGTQFWYAVVGVVDDVLRPDRQGDGAGSFYYTAFFPVQPNKAMSYYVIRSAPQDRQRVIGAAEKVLGTLDVNAVAKGKRFSDIRDKYFANTRSMVWMLALVCLVMLAVTAFGIVGLTSFWVAQRRRQIGIRRAVGATRGDILSYFRTENFLLSSFGVVLGMALAFGINLYLMRSYEMDRMPWYYLPGGAIALWLLGQIAVFGPAYRAASVPPVEATRS